MSAGPNGPCPYPGKLSVTACCLSSSAGALQHLYPGSDQLVSHPPNHISILLTKDLFRLNTQYNSNLKKLRQTGEGVKANDQDDVTYANKCGMSHYLQLTLSSSIMSIQQICPNFPC